MPEVLVNNTNVIYLNSPIHFSQSRKGAKTQGNIGILIFSIWYYLTGC